MAEITCGTGSGSFPQPGDPDLNNSILNAAPAFGGIDVTWTYPELLPEAVAHVRLYRSTNADPATAVLLRRVSGELYHDTLDPLKGVTYYYWIEIVSVNGTIGDLIGPASAMARPTIDQTIEMLSGRVNDSHLAQSLRDNIQRIDLVSSDLEAETAARFAQYDGLQSDLAAYQQDVDGVATLLASEVNRLDDADTAQISQINVLGAKTDDNAAQIVSEAEARATADEALAKDYEVLKASSANVYYQSAAPDPAVVSLQEHDIWVDTTEPSDGSEPSYDQYQWDGSQWVPSAADTLAGVHAAVEAEKLARTNRNGALAQDVQTLEASVGRKSRTYFQANPPVAENIGDLWIDTNNNNALYYWTGSEWVDAWDRRIVEALQDVADAQQSALDAMSAAEQAQATADGAIRTYYQSNAPTGLNSTTDVGDLWFDTDDDQAYRWNGSTWKIIEDNTISKALAAAEGAQATADGKITTFRQSTQPTAEGVGDMWIHTGNKNRLYLWTGSQWADARDSDISVGVSRNQVFRQATAPSASNPGDLWFDSDNDDKGYRWTGSAWEPLNLYTGNQVTAAIQDFKQSQVGYCMINGSPDRNRTNKSDCESAGGTWLDMHAIANVVKGVQITDGDNQTANVEQRMRSYKNDIGQLLSEYTVKVQTDTNGNKIVGGFGLTADGATVEAGFDVDRFWVGKLGNKRFPFIIDTNTNEVFMDEAVIRQLTFNKLRAEDGSIMTTPAVYDEAGNLVTPGKLRAAFIDAEGLSAETFYGDVNSETYETGKSGWRLAQNGNAEFNNVLFRGQIDGSVIKGSTIRGSVINGSVFVTPTDAGDPFLALTTNLSWSHTNSWNYGWVDAPPIDIYSYNHSDTTEYRRSRKEGINASIRMRHGYESCTFRFQVLLGNTVVADTGSRYTSGGGNISGTGWSGSYGFGTREVCSSSYPGGPADNCRTERAGSYMNVNLQNFPYSGDSLMRFRYYIYPGNSSYLDADFSSIDISISVVNDY